MPIRGLNSAGSLVINPGSSTPGTLATDMRNANGAWWVIDYLPLFGFPQDRGANVLIPSAAGLRAYQRKVDQTTYQLPMLISGDVVRSGSSTASTPLRGLRLNIEDLRTNVCGPYSSTATRSALLTDDASHTYSADVQIRLTLGEVSSKYECRAILELTIPAGPFA